MAAGSIDIMTFFAANGRADPGFKESATEEVDSLLGWTFVGKAFDFVVGDEVYFGEKAASVLGEKSGLFGGIIDSGEENIFKENLFLFGTNKDVTGLEKAVEREPFIDGHDFVSDGVAGGMKREGEAELEWVISQLLDLGGESAGGDGDVAGTHAEVGGGDEEIESGQKVGEVS